MFRLKLMINIKGEEHWLARAEETRVLAEMCRCKETREMMLRIALGYVNTAVWAASQKVRAAGQTSRRVLT